MESPAIMNEIICHRDAAHSIHSFYPVRFIDAFIGARISYLSGAIH